MRPRTRRARAEFYNAALALIIAHIRIELPLVCMHRSDIGRVGKQNDIAVTLRSVVGYRNAGKRRIFHAVLFGKGVQFVVALEYSYFTGGNANALGYVKAVQIRIVGTAVRGIDAIRHAIRERASGNIVYTGIERVFLFRERNAFIRRNRYGCRKRRRQVETIAHGRRRNFEFARHVEREFSVAAHCGNVVFARYIVQRVNKFVGVFALRRHRVGRSVCNGFIFHSRRERHCHVNAVYRYRVSFGIGMTNRKRRIHVVARRAAQLVVQHVCVVHPEIFERHKQIHPLSVVAHNGFSRGIIAVSHGMRFFEFAVYLDPHRQYGAVLRHKTHEIGTRKIGSYAEIRFGCRSGKLGNGSAARYMFVPCRSRRKGHVARVPTAYIVAPKRCAEVYFGFAVERRYRVQLVEQTHAEQKFRTTRLFARFHA